jgi:hypothetical protein
MTVTNVEEKNSSCERCGKNLEIQDVFTILHGAERRWNMAWLCEECADEILAAQSREVAK